MALKDVFTNLVSDATNKIVKAVTDELVNLITKAGPHGSVSVADLQHTVDQLKAGTTSPTHK